MSESYRFVIRPARENDVNRIREIAEASYAVYLPRMDRKPFPMNDDYLLHIAKGSIYVLDVAGEIVGYVVLLHTNSSRLLLDNIAVAPACQKQGLGRALMAFAEEEALRRGVSAIDLYTNVCMTENLDWYPSLGYQEICRKNENGYQRVYFRKTLP